MEIWRDVPGLAGYQVSNLGRVKNKTGHIMKRYYHEDMRQKAPFIQFVRHFSDGTTANTHRSLAGVVLSAFVGPGATYRTQIGYRDGNVDNCELSNLYYTFTGHEEPQTISRDEIDTEGVLALWNAICDEVIKDLYYGKHPRSREDKLHAAEAKAFMLRDYWFYIGEEPDAMTLKEIAGRVETYGKRKKQKRKTDPPEKVPKHKKRCLKCYYSWIDTDRGVLDKRTAEHHVYCGYMLKTGHRRPCPAEDCTVFKKRGREDG